MRPTIVLRLKQALGDAIAFTGVVRDLLAQHPDVDWRLDVNWRPVWDAFPIALLTPPVGVPRYDVGYTEGVRASRTGRVIHLMRALAEDVTRHTGRPVSLTVPAGVIRVYPSTPPVRGRYWVICAGGKQDMTAKVWPAGHWQALVDRLRALGVDCVQAGAAATGHFHPRLTGCLSAVGRTESFAELVRLVHYADGVVCGVTGLAHLAAALSKPCVVIGGGREEPWFYAYHNAYRSEAFGPDCRPVAVEHRILHTVGRLDCCTPTGCWRKRVIPLDIQDRTRPQRVCVRPVVVAGTQVPECLVRITPEHVVAAVASYYADGTLPPLSHGDVR